MQGPQGQQGPMPGQAQQQQQPMPGMMPQQGAATPAAMVGPLTQMHMQQLVQLMLNPRPDGPPLYAVISAIDKKQKEDKAMQAAQGQQIMAQNAQMQQQPPVAAQVMQAAEQMQEPVMAAYGGEMHGYAGGGAVAFNEGGRTFGYAPDYELARKYGISLSPYDSPSVREEKIKRARAMADFEEQRKSFGDIPTEASVANDQALQQAYASPSRARDVLQTGIAAAAPVRPPAPAPMQPARRPPAGNKPSAMSQGLGFLAEQPSTPGPDTLSDIESKGIAGIRGVQDVYRQQGTTDPELMKLREAAYKSSQDIAARRERDRQAALQAAQAASADPTDLLLAMAGAGAGGRTALEVLGGAAKGAGTARAAKRAELQKAQEISRQEQNAIDQLNQALADKRVADRSGDVNKMEAANRAVAEAELKVTDLRSGIQTQRATEADRAEQRRLTERGQNLQQETAREQMANALKVAQTRGALAGERGALTPRDIARFRAQAEKDVDAQLKTDPRYVSMRVRDPVGAETYRTTIIDKRLERVLAEEGYGGAAPPPPAGKEIDFNAIGKK